MHDPRRFAPATARNRDPILDVLRRFVRPSDDILEIASGSGEHALYLAPRLDVATWQPSDSDPEARASIDAWRVSANDARILPAIDLDVTAHPWPALRATPNVIACVNMIHIAPWRACEALFRGAAASFHESMRGEGARAAFLYLYGPYRREGRHTAPSNEAFNRNLRSRNPEWGVRDLELVTTMGREHGFELASVVPMPANNFSVVFARRAKLS